LATASRGIAKITHHYTQNIDLEMLKPYCIIAEQLLWDHLFLLVKIELKEAIVAALDSPVVK
jgi:hypothetical protein